MAKTISNVLTGVATLSIREPNDAIAEWSRTQKYAGSWSAKLYKGNSGDAGSTHVQLTPPTGITLTTFVADPTDYSFYHYCSAVLGNFMQFELKFEDPDSDAWVEATLVPYQNYTGLVSWVKYTSALTDKVGFGGIDEAGLSFSDWDLSDTVATLITGIDATTVVDCGPWILTRVRVELWEATPERTCYINSIEVDGTTYTIEPGGTAPALSFSSPYTEVGYTEDGVTLEYSADTADIEVEEETFPIDRVITKEGVQVTCNMAESSLYNMDKAMAGAVLSGNIIRLGDGTMKTVNLKIEGTSPAGYLRAIQIPLATSMGTVAMPYKKGEKTVVPVTFGALKGDSEAVTIVDNAA